MLIDNFNNTIEIWITALNDYEVEQLLIKPEVSSWTIGQVYTHLIEETNWYIGEIKICLSNDENASGQMKQGAKAIFDNNEFPNEKIMGDPSTAAEMKQPESKEELQQTLKEIKFHMNMLWNEILSTKYNGKTRHPGNGYFNARQWFQHTEMHLRHHLRQKQRIDIYLNSSI
jgi:hypothetical protein